MLDPKLAKFDEEEVVRVINIILLCTVGLPEQRPPMSKVVSMLTEDTEMSEVDMSMWPSYVPQWQRKSGSDSFFASLMQQSSGTESLRHQAQETTQNPMGKPPHLFCRLILSFSLLREGDKSPRVLFLSLSESWSLFLLQTLCP